VNSICTVLCLLV